MTSGMTPQQLVAQRRYAQALEQLERQQQRNQRVYGLNELAAKVRQVMATADASVAEARSLVEQGRLREVIRRLRQVRESVVDHPALTSLLPELEQRMADGRELRDNAQRLTEEGRFNEAKTAVEQAIGKDPESSTAQRQLQAITQAIHDERVGSRARRMLVVCGAAGVLLLLTGIIGIVMFNRWSQHAQAARHQASVQAQHDFGNALAQIKAEHYQQADKSLSTAEQELRAENMASDPLFASIVQTRSSEAMKQGLAGLVPLDDGWVKPDKRKAVLQQRQDLSKGIDSLIVQIKNWLNGKMANLPAAEGGQADRLNRLLQSAYDARASFGQADYDGADQAYQKITASLHGDFQKAGLVLYKQQWITQQQAHDQRMRDQGLVHYGDRWVTPDEKFALEQKAKGLVLFEGQWKTPAQVQQIKENRRAVAVRAEHKREAAAEAAHKRHMEQLAPVAYEMSKKFVKDILKAPASAQFPDYSDNSVIVVEGKTHGHFLVKAYVDAQNGFGAMLRNGYIVELWPLDDEGNRWKANTPVLLKDN